MRHARLQRRLLIILAVAAASVTVGSAVALLAMVDIGREFQAVTRSELPETTAALRLARIGERIQSRAPALVAAFDADERAEQALLIEADLAALSGELAALAPLHTREPEPMNRIAGTIADLDANLRDISGYLARRDTLDQARSRLLGHVLTLEDDARQILGPSILAVHSVVQRPATPLPNGGNDIRAAAVQAQGPLLEAERLVTSLINGVFVAAEADALRRVTTLRARSARQISRLEDVVAAMPSGLRPGMEALTASLSDVLHPETGLFAVRTGELEALRAAERLLALNRILTDRLSRDVDSVVQAANASIRAAAGRVQETIVDHSVGFVLFSIAAVAVAAALSWFFVIRDVGRNLRRVTEAMSRLAAGERTVEVPAMDRRDEIGALARAFDVFRDTVFKMEAIEAQLRQAQKMEIIGQLSGGLAHDFNNILSVILGNLHVLDDGLIDRPGLRERATRALGAAERAGQQIERLLAVSRRLNLSPERLDVTDLVTGMFDLLEASVGPGITLDADLEAALPAVIVDPGQLENSLLNLVVNARDALAGAAEGGTISILTAFETGDDPTRNRVILAVRDTGPGIPAELIERVFEPFFTTKATGRGSGLGLAMVYGFVTQSGGTVRIDSLEGHGTKVTLSLPVAPPLEPAGSAGAGVLGSAPELAEPILLVDDEPAVRDAVASALRHLGYTVLEAADAAEALALLRQGFRPGLLFSDVFLGEGDGENGFALAHNARAIQPDLPVLLSSGGTADDLARLASFNSELEVLVKPVAADTLADAIGRTLAAQARSTTVSKT